MKKISKILCVILALFVALFAGGCVNSGDIESRLDNILSDIQSQLEEEISKLDSGFSSPEEPASSDFESIPDSFGDSDEDSSTDSSGNSSDGNSQSVPEEPDIDENGSYSSKEDVALYIHTYGKLPRNFITKNEARKLGWIGGSLEKFAPGKCIGGDYFGNNEGLLPKKSGRKYTECDIDTLGKDFRGAKRIVFSNDGLIYYTDDHYESFTLLYGEE